MNDRRTRFLDPDVELRISDPDLRTTWHVAQARLRRIEAMVDGFADVGRGLAWLARAGARSLARRRRQWETRAALMGCSDRVLEDIGIAREHIPLLARGINPAPVEPRRAVLSRRLRAWAAAVSAGTREQRRVYRELMTYSDRELDDLGVRRRDIPAIARTAATA